MNKFRLLFVFLLTLMGFSVMAQDDMMSPSVAVVDQISTNGTVTIAEVYSDGPGFIVIHADNDGAFGVVVGHRAINDGTSYNVSVAVDADLVTPTLYAMLHSDTNEVGTYEFGVVDGADTPVAVDGAVVSPAFNVELVHIHNQLLDGNVLTANHIVTGQDGFIVIHSNNEGRPGPVIGYAPVSAGANADVEVTLDSEVTGTIFPMLHVDSGEAGVYEFGTVEGADGPVRVNDAVLVFPITVNQPSMHVADQIVDNMVMAHSVVSEGPGWLVIHSDNEGAPGPVLGYAPVEAGSNTNVVVEIEGDVTPVIYPMLHVDTGVEGEYEFGTVEGADGPVRVNDAVLVFPVNAAPAISYEGSMSGNVLTVASALIDAQGWLVIHSDNEGAPGPVLGYAPLVAGLNSNVAVTIDGEATETVFPMLHYDTGEAGVYEFGTVEGADGPVRVGEAVVVGPLTPSMME